METDLLIVCTSQQRYAVRRDQLLGLRMIITAEDMERPDDRGKPVNSMDLGEVLGINSQATHHHRHALVVPSRRRSVLLLVDRVEHLCAAMEERLHPFPRLLRHQVARPWFLGVLIEPDAMPVLVLDVRQIAQDILMKTRSQTHATNHEQHRQVHHL
jgi:hypothetical protein